MRKLGPLNILSALASVLFLFVAASCANNKTREDISASKLPYAELLRIQKEEGYTRVEILNPADTSSVLGVYNLVKSSDPLPANMPEGMLIRTPVKRAIVYSSVYAGALDELNSIEIVKGVTDAEYHKHPKVKQGLESGEILDVGPNATPSVEKMIAAKPDVVLVSWYNGVNLAELQKLGLPLVYMADSMEKTPLGRAEWLKFLGLLVDNEDLATEIFDEVAKNYTDLASERSATHPKVLTENIYQGVWYVPGGASYQANLIKDAGGLYPWADDTSSGSLSLGIEQVLEKASDADVWLLKLYDQELSADKLVKMNPLYSNFKAFRDGNVFYCDTKSSNLFEEFPFHPDRLLRDYHLIFTTLSPDSLRYFTRMKP